MKQPDKAKRGRSNRLKGKRGEIEARNWLREHGIECSDRLLGQTRDGGHDLETDIGNVEVKRRKSLSIYDWLDAAPMEARPRLALARGDNRRWLVVMDAEDAVALLKLERSCKHARIEWTSDGDVAPPAD